MKGGLRDIRTNLSILAVSATMAMTAAMIVSYGSEGIIAANPKSDTWFLLPSTLFVGVCAVLLYLAKSLRTRRARFIPGSLACLMLAWSAGVSLTTPAPTSASFFMAATLACLHALWFDEPPAGASRRDSVVLMGAVFAALFGILVFAFGERGLVFDAAPAFAVPMIVLGVLSGWAHLLRPRSSVDALLRSLLGAGFLAMTVAILIEPTAEPIETLPIVPIGLILVAYPWFKRFQLGQPEGRDLTEENRVVLQFDRVTEVVTWTIFLFTLIHLSFHPIGIRNAVFGMFVAIFSIFALSHHIDARLTFDRFYWHSMANAALIAAIAHITGGLQSPYAWFFVIVLYSGSVTPNPRHILNRLGLIATYYFFETIYTISQGSMNSTLAVDYLMPQLFVVGLTGLYSHQLAVRRMKIDSNLLAANEGLTKSLERERANKELIERQAVEIEEAKKRNEAMLESLADGVVGLEADGSITFMNASAEGFIGVSTKDARGKRFRDLIVTRREDDPDFRIGDYLDSALNGNAIPLPEDVYLVKDEGSKAYFAGVAVPIYDGKKKPEGAILVFHDVSYVREVDQMKTGFLSVAAHQLRTPLSTIRWYLELLNDPTEGKLKKNQKMFAENAYLSLRKMVGLVNRLLAVTRLESGRVPFKPEPTDLRALTRDIVDGLKQKLDERKLDISISIPDLPAVPLDPTLAREVFVNLIENAIRYTPDGGKISIEASDEGDRVVWSVTDTGIGIPKAQQERIFEKFFRAGNAVEYTSEGSGLGLYLAKFIVDAWGGKIGFTSKEGKGAVFRVTVPKSGMRKKAGQVSLNA